jgi:acetyl esterase/lipase
MNEPYMAGTDPKDPLVVPVVSLNVLSKFPPTLFISGTRDTMLSSVLYSHSRLIKAGAEADLHVWDGMWHAFWFNVDLPDKIGKTVNRCRMECQELVVGTLDCISEEKDRRT